MEGNIGRSVFPIYSEVSPDSDSEASGVSSEEGEDGVPAASPSALRSLYQSFGKRRVFLQPG